MLKPSACDMRNTLARRFRATLGKDASAAKGALGISSNRCAAAGIERLTATSMPPAETLRAVANSKNSLSVSARPRTKTGMAKGRRGHRRRSVVAVLRFTHTPSLVRFDLLIQAHWVPKPELGLKGPKQDL